MTGHPRKPRRTPGRRRAKECAKAIRVRDWALLMLADMPASSLLAERSKLRAERDEARASLETVNGLLDDARKDAEVQRQRGVELFEEKERLRASNAKLTEDCFRIRKSRDEAEARAGEMARERDRATKKGCEVAFENDQLKERNAALREEIALLRANGKVRT